MSCEDISTVMFLIDFLMQWISPKNKAFKMSEPNEASVEKDKKNVGEIESWDEFRIRLLNELTLVDQRFPNQAHMNRLSTHVIKIA